MCNIHNTRKIDTCLINVINEINEVNQLRTISSCCGHDIYQKTIIVEDLLNKVIFEWFTGNLIKNKYKNGKKRKRFYKKDKKGYYYLDPDLKLKKNRLMIPKHEFLKYIYKKGEKNHEKIKDILENEDYDNIMIIYDDENIMYDFSLEIVYLVNENKMEIKKWYASNNNASEPNKITIFLSNLQNMDDFEQTCIQIEYFFLVERICLELKRYGMYNKKNCYPCWIHENVCEMIEVEFIEDSLEDELENE